MRTGKSSVGRDGNKRIVSGTGFSKTGKYDCGGTVSLTDCDLGTTDVSFARGNVEVTGRRVVDIKSSNVINAASSCGTGYVYSSCKRNIICS